MDDELVLFTSYFNLAGGRRQDTADTFRVDPNLPSPSSPDGSAALYVVTEASMGGNMGPRARRLAADVVAWEYASHGEEPPAARLKAALLSAHEAVLEEFDGHVAVGMSVIAVERDTVYLGQVAPAQVYVLHEGSLHSISASAEGTSPFVGALGANNGAQVTVFRDQVGPEDIVAPCASWFHRGADTEDLRECFGAGSADDIAEALLELAKQHSVRDATVIVIEATLASELELEVDEDEPPTLLEQVDTAVQALAGVSRMLWGELRSHADGPEEDGRAERPRSPIRDFAFSDEQPPAPSRDAAAPMPDSPLMRTATLEPEPARGPAGSLETEPTGDYPRTDQATDEVPILSPASGSGDHAGYQSRESLRGAPDAAAPISGSPAPLSAQEASSDAPSASGVAPAPAGQQAPQPRVARTPQPVSELDQVNSRIQSAPDLGDVIPPVQTFPDTSTEPERIYATSKHIQAVNKRPRRFGGARPAGRDVSDGPPVIRPSLGDLDLSRPASRPAPPAVIWFSIAVVMILAAVGLYKVLHRTHTVAVNPYPAKFQHNLAMATTHPAQQDLYLNRARQDIALARQDGTKSKQIRSMTYRWQTTSDNLHHIARQRAPILLSNFGLFPNAQPTAIAASPSMIFVLDAGRKSVFSVTPYATSNPSLIVQQGESDSGFTIGMPRQIATDGSTALVLDEHNVLVRDVSGTKTATSLTQPTQTPEGVAAMASYDPDVYLLDTANGQLWRYPSAVSGFSPQPAGFFSPNTPGTPNLSHAVSVAFDQSSVYVLQAGGLVQKFDYLQANPQKFSITLHTPLQKPLSIVTGPGLNFVWIADPSNARILQFDKSGGFIRTFRSGAATMDFNRILSFAVSPDGRLMYVLCRSGSSAKLFQFPIPR